MPPSLPVTGDLSVSPHPPLYVFQILLLPRRVIFSGWADSVSFGTVMTPLTTWEEERVSQGEGRNSRELLAMLRFWWREETRRVRKEGRERGEAKPPKGGWGERNLEGRRAYFHSNKYSSTCSSSMAQSGEGREEEEEEGDVHDKWRPIPETKFLLVVPRSLLLGKWRSAVLVFVLHVLVNIIALSDV
jgi:hypothetical protein